MPGEKRMRKIYKKDAKGLSDASQNTFSNNEFWTAVGFSCAWLLSSGGLKSALEFMLGMLKPVTPVCRINLGCASFGREKFVAPLCDTISNGMERTRIPRGKFPFLIISENTVDKPTIINDLARYKTEALKLDPSVRNLPFFKHSSVLRLPLFTKNGLIFWIAFWSDHSDAFTLSDVELYGALIKPCLSELKNILMYEVAGEVKTTEAMHDLIKLSSLSGMSGICQKVRKVAPTNATVLITGESGVGKEVLAETVFSLSKRAENQFICVNCGAFTSTLITSELFGVEKGAYTGATSTREGYFEFASGGTIFLDEIGELPLQAQVMLLRVLDKKFIQRVGSPRNIAVDVRVIAATNRDLEELVKKGEFREDLYYRLTTYPIHIPPLRQRREDILPLARNILAVKYKDYNLKEEPKLAHAEEAKLLAYDWPGNVRELVNVLENALINLTPDTKLLHVDLPDQNHVIEYPLAAKWPTLEELEKNHISKTLAKTKGRLGGADGAAALLGIHYTTLHAKLKKYSLASKD